VITQKAHGSDSSSTRLSVGSDSLVDDGTIEPPKIHVLLDSLFAEGSVGIGRCISDQRRTVEESSSLSGDCSSSGLWVGVILRDYGSVIALNEIKVVLQRLKEVLEMVSLLSTSITDHTLNSNCEEEESKKDCRLHLAA